MAVHVLALVLCLLAGGQSLAIDVGAGGDASSSGERLVSFARRLRTIYETKIEPAETFYQYHKLKHTVLKSAPLYTKPVLLFAGPARSGKTTAINYLLTSELAPTESKRYFTLLSYTDGAAHGLDDRLQKALGGQPDAAKHVAQIDDKNKMLAKYTIVDSQSAPASKAADSAYWPTLHWLLGHTDLTLIVLDAKTDARSLTGYLNSLLAHAPPESAGRYRIVLNRAAELDEQELMHNYGELVWSMAALASDGPRRHVTAPRVYVVSLADKKERKGHKLAKFFAKEEEELLRDIAGTTKAGEYAVDTSELCISMLQHARRIKVHAQLVRNYLLAYKRRCRLSREDNQKLIDEIKAHMSASLDGDSAGELDTLLSNADYVSTLDYDALVSAESESHPHHSISSDYVHDGCASPPPPPVHIDDDRPCLLANLEQAIEADLPRLLDGDYSADESAEGDGGGEEEASAARVASAESEEELSKATEEESEEEEASVSSEQAAGTDATSAEDDADEESEEADEHVEQVKLSAQAERDVDVDDDDEDDEEGTESDSSDESSAEAPGYHATSKEAEVKASAEEVVDEKESEEETDETDVTDAARTKQECKFRKSCYETGVLPRIDQSVFGRIAAEAGADGDGAASYFDERTRMKLRCKFRRSCYETGELPEIGAHVWQPSAAELSDDDEADSAFDKAAFSEATMVKLRCKFRKSCYETGVLPDIVHTAPVAYGARTTDDSGEVHYAVDERYARKLRCKFRQSCYETGELPEIERGFFVWSSRVADDEQSEEEEAGVDKAVYHEELQKKVDCKYRVSCYDTGVVPDIAASVFARSAELHVPEVRISRAERIRRMKLACRYRTSCYDYEEYGIEESSEEDEESEDGSRQEDGEVIDEDELVLDDGTVDKLRCKYRRSCYETGRVPRLRRHVFAGAASAQAAAHGDEFDQSILHDANRLKLHCHFRKSCYDTGVVPQSFRQPETQSKAHKGERRQLTEEDMKAAEERRALRLHCRYRKSCYTTKVRPASHINIWVWPQVQLHRADADDSDDEHTTGVRKELERHRQLRLHCRYRKSCYESGDRPKLTRSVFAPPVHKDIAVSSEEHGEHRSESSRMAARRLACKYRKSCYESGVPPAIERRSIFASPPSASRVDSVSVARRANATCMYRISCRKAIGLSPRAGSLKHKQSIYVHGERLCRKKKHVA